MCKRIILAMALLLTVAGNLHASPSRDGKVIGGTSSGFSTIGSETIYITDLSFDYFFHRDISIGYEMLVGIGDFFLWGNQGVGKYTFDIPSNDWARNLTPYIQMQMGFGLLTNGSTEATFLGGFGWGADYYVDPRWALGTNMLFNFGNDIASKNFAFIWKVVTVKYIF